MKYSIAVWEDEGGAQAGVLNRTMRGTVNQIDWALEIREQVNAEFDRVRTALQRVAQKDPVRLHSQTEAIITILEDKRAEIMGRVDAGYFIHDWQETASRVRRLILEDSRYKALRPLN